MQAPRGEATNATPPQNNSPPLLREDELSSYNNTGFRVSIVEGIFTIREVGGALEGGEMKLNSLCRIVWVSLLQVGVSQN